MTPLEFILQAAENAAPGVKWEYGFGDDLEDFLAQERVSGDVGFISYMSSDPQGYRSDGKARGYVDIFAVFFRQRRGGRAITAIPVDALAVRDALDGANFNDHNGDYRRVRILPLAALGEGSYRAFQINLEVS